MKHAFLILAHNEPEVLSELIKRLQHNDITIYIHIDKKANFDFKTFKKENCYSNVIYVKRNNLYWGEYSLVKETLKLIKKSLKVKYDYYHLISGVTLPIKKVDDILNFFNLNCGKEFITFCPDDQVIISHFNKYHFYSKTLFGKKIDRVKDKLFNLKLRNLAYNDIRKYKKTHQWFSITNSFARYLVSKKRWIKKNFNHTIVPDEMFVGTLLFNSPFYNNSYGFNLTYVDWINIYNQKQSLPCILNNNYLGILKKTNLFFARKFDSSYKDFYYKLFE